MAFLLPPSLMALIDASLAYANTDNNALATARFSHTGYFQSPRAATANPDARAAEHDQFDLLDIVLVAGVDGKFHAFNRSSGQAVWSMTSQPPSNSTTVSSLAPLIRTANPNESLEQDEDYYQEMYVIEPQSGEIFVLPSPSAPLQQFPYTMQQLVDMSPFSFHGESERRFFIGKKETSLLALELETGRVRQIDGECPWDPDPWKQTETEVDLDELEDMDSAGNTQPQVTEVLIGRTDYHISIHAHTPHQRPKPIQKLTFSTYGPNNQDHALQASYRRPKDDRYIQSMPGGEIISLRLKTEHGETQAGSAGWGHKFTEPIVAVFDILRRQDSDSAFALLQPRPRLADVLAFHNFASPSSADSSHDGLPQALLDALPNLNSAFVGAIRDSGSLYAMSPERFPLVAFGASNSAEHGYYLDAPSGSDPPLSAIDDEIPLEVDAITRARKLREQMDRERQRCYSTDPSSDQGRLVLDPSCLTGVRRLESGSTDRARRLLDGVPGVEPQPGVPNELPHNVELIEGGDTEAQAPRNNATGGSWWIWRSGRYWSGNAGPLGLGIPSRDGLNSSVPSRGIFGAGGAGLGFGLGYADFLFTILVGAVGMIGVWMRYVKSKRPREHSRKAKDHGRFAEVTPESTPESAPTASSNSASASEPSNLMSAHPDARDLEPTPSPLQLSRSDSSSAAEAIINSAVQPNGNGSHLDLKPLDDVDESDKDGDGDMDNDNDGDATPATPGRRKGIRRKRGKKKKVNVVLPTADSSKEEANKQNGAEEKPPQSGIVMERARKESSSGPSLTVSDTVLGFGSHGTVVFRGSLQGRAVAVKRLLIDFVTLASREVSILQESDDHPNVIRYYYQEASGGFLYIALELCPASLADIIETPDREQWQEIAVSFDPKRALKQITSGLRHLHALKLVHRDIKPQNILVSAAKGGQASSVRGGKWRMLISDFGLCKKLDMDQTSFLPTAHGAMAAGTVGWRAPEILRGEVRLDESATDDQSMSSRGSVATPTSSYSGTTPSSHGKPTRLTKSVDIFALGCLYYYTLTSGGHPYGDRFEREVNIMKNAKCLEGLERFGEEGAEAIDLIEKMLDPEAKNRPDTTTCLLHPFFWDPGRRLTFLQDASDRFEIMCRDPKEPALLTLETNAFNVVGLDWLSRLDKLFIENLGKFRKYDGKSVQDLLRALRNKKNHYQDLPDNVKRHLGPMPEGFLSYFTRRYPRLFLHVHSVIGETGLNNESMFRSYYELADQ
ncbi:bifunctional endoribonuclease/protein kinase ire1 [Pleurotus pulmonarius]|nr:bifunctional endoribonuclease/protein kinase ire1 [Pleurotus pulmonarius]